MPGHAFDAFQNGTTLDLTLGDSADFTENLGTGGSIFHALGFGFSGDGGDDIIGQAAGLSGAWDNLADLVTAALGIDTGA